jgi:PAS domain S-box-containing protein
LLLLNPFNPFTIASDLNNPEPKRVLVIYSYHEGLPWERIIDDSLRATLVSKSTEPIELNVEHADRIRYPDDAYLKNFVDLIRHKYSHPKMDVVIGIDDEATDILLQYGEKLFPGVPIVFVTAERKTLKRDSLKPNMTSLLWGADIQGTVDLICEMLPKTRQIFIITGSSLSDRAAQKLARGALRGYTNRLEINYLPEITRKDLMERVKRLPERSVLLYLAFSRDSEGKNFVPLEILSDISRKANAPAFGILDTYLGFGIVGGRLLSAEVQGRRCAEICLRILNGESPVDIVPERTRNIMMFDQRQLKRWSISEEKLPPESIVRYREFSIWQQYRWQIIGLIAFGLIQISIIILLWVQWVKRRHAEAKTHESEVKYRTVADYTYDWEYWQAPDKSMNYVSPSCESITGYRPDEFIDHPDLLDQIVIPADRDIWSDHQHEADRNMSMHEVQFRIRRKNGDICWIEHVCQPIRDDQGRFMGFRASNRDMSKRKRSENALIESDQGLRDAQRIAHLGTWQWDSLTGKLKWSDEVFRIFGLTPPHGASYHAFLESVHPKDRSTVEKAVKQTLENPGAGYDIQHRIVRPDGSIRVVHERGEVVVDKDGKPLHMIGTVHDISEVKDMETESKRLQNELAHMNRVATMGALTSAIAHEVNQPLAAILSNTQAALRFLNHEDPDLDEVREALSDIVQDDKRAADVIRRLRRMVKKEEPVHELFDINTVIEAAIHLLDSEIISQNISLLKDLKSGIPALYGDPIQIQQVIINLLTNAMHAMKDRPEDSRRVSLSTRSDRDKGVAVTVIDSGPGLTTDQIETVFNPFYTTKTEGMGLGLAVCQLIIEAHGGHIQVENGPDGGAMFSFILPVDNK